MATEQRQLISEQHKGQRVLLAENTFLKSVINTLNIKLDGKFRHYIQRTVKVFIRKENMLLKSNKIPAAAEIHIL